MSFQKSLILPAVLIAAVAFAQQTPPPSAPPSSAPATATSSSPDDANDPLLDAPPLPKSPVTLVGGTVTSIDHVRNKLSVEPYGGKKMKFFFDERTHIYRDGAETTQLGIHKGDRVYVDTQLDGSRIFARNIRVETQSASADARGQILSYDPQRGTITVRDELSAEPVSFGIGTNTTVHGKGNSASDLLPGALVQIHFLPGRGGQRTARDIFITARPGEIFTFAGQVTYLDMSRGILALHNQADDKAYEIAVPPALPDASRLAVGSDVTISAAYDGSGYKAQTLSVASKKQ